MAKEAHIYVYGDIGICDLYMPINPVLLKDVVEQANSPENKGAKTFVVHINSSGGLVSEGKAIHDFLRNSGKHIITQIDGLCASIANRVLLAGDERRMAANGELMVHNPWTGIQGEASDLRAAADSLEKTEAEEAAFYADRTGLDIETVAELMQQTTFMTAKEALEYGFITKIMGPSVQAKQLLLQAKASHTKQGKFQAVAIFNPKHKTNTMSKKTTTKATGFKAMLMALINPAQMKSYKTSDGGSIETDSEDDIAEGQTITTGAPEGGGDVVLEDGRTVTIDAEGKVTGIADAEAGTDDEAMAQALAEGIQAAVTNAIAPVLAKLQAIEERQQDQEDGIVAMAKSTKTNYQPKARVSTPQQRENPATKQEQGKKTTGTLAEQMAARKEGYKAKK